MSTVYSKRCKVCNSDSLSQINSYKYYWYYCNDCSSIFTEKKKKYFLEYIIPKKIAKHILPKGLYNLYYTSDIAQTDEKSNYDYYADVIKIPIEKTKWASLPEKIEYAIARYMANIILPSGGGGGGL